MHTKNHAMIFTQNNIYTVLHKRNVVLLNLLKKGKKKQFRLTVIGQLFRDA